MNYLEFDRNRAQYDMFDAPHIAGRGFISFASGEVIFTDPKPTDRRHSRERDVQIVATGDDDCPALYTEPQGGDPVTKASLNQRGMQYLAIDHECGVAVQLAMGVSRYGRVGGEYRLRDVDHWVPHYLTGRFAAYWAGPGRRPIGNPITVSEPYIPTKEQKQHLRDLKDQADTWAALTDLPQFSTKVYYPIPAHKLFDVDFADLSDDMKKNLHYRSHTNFRVETKHPYLYVRKT
jgi:hypothetical protein